MAFDIIINGQGPEPPNTMYASGGTARLIAIMKRLSKKESVNLYVISSKSVCDTFIKNGIKANYRIVPSTLSENTIYYSKLLMDSMFRMVRVCFLGLPARKGILYSPSDFLWDVFPAFIWKLRNKNVKWVQLIFHLIPSNRFISHFAQKVSFFFIKRFADLVIVDSRILKKELIRQGFNANRIEVNPPGIDVKYFKNIKASKEKGYDATFLARLHPSKGTFDLVEIWKLVCQKKPNAKLAIIGDGDGKIVEELEKKITNANLDHNIDVLGYLEDDEAFGIMKSSRVFVFPSHEEGFGIVILEAMACGLPIVAWDLPVYSEAFPRGMIRVPISYVKEFAKIVLKLLDDKQLAVDVAREARGITRRYDWDKIANRDLELIENLVVKEHGA